MIWQFSDALSGQRGDWRSSGTEPLIRVMAEGDDKVLVEAAVDDVVEALMQVAA